MKNRSPQHRHYTDSNREAWDEVAPIHARPNQAELVAGFSKPGYSTLWNHSVECLSEVDVSSKSVAHLCCNNGCDLLSVKNMGAGKCIGFDASAPFIEQARELARAARHEDVEFVVTDVYDIPTLHHAVYDLTMTTIGVLSWMPDLKGFFEVVYGLTAPGGFYFMEEMHPVLLMYEEDADGGPCHPVYSYFKKDPLCETTGLDYYTGTTYQAKPNYSFQHTLADIITTAMKTGLTLRVFTEFGYDISGFCKDLEHVEATPPMGMTMLWHKPAE